MVLINKKKQLQKMNNYQSTLFIPPKNKDMFLLFIQEKVMEPVEASKIKRTLIKELQYTKQQWYTLLDATQLYVDKPQNFSFILFYTFVVMFN